MPGLGDDLVHTAQQGAGGSVPVVLVHRCAPLRGRGAASYQRKGQYEQDERAGRGRAPGAMPSGAGHGIEAVLVGEFRC